jgi:hypothetical protein
VTRRFLREFLLLCPLWLGGFGCGIAVGVEVDRRLHAVWTMQKGTRILLTLWENTL